MNMSMNTEENYKAIITEGHGDMKDLGNFFIAALASASEPDGYFAFCERKSLG